MGFSVFLSVSPVKLLWPCFWDGNKTWCQSRYRARMPYGLWCWLCKYRWVGLEPSTLHTFLHTCLLGSRKVGKYLQLENCELHWPLRIFISCIYGLVCLWRPGLILGYSLTNQYFLLEAVPSTFSLNVIQKKKFIWSYQTPSFMI